MEDSSWSISWRSTAFCSVAFVLICALPLLEIISHRQPQLMHAFSAQPATQDAAATEDLSALPSTPAAVTSSSAFLQLYDRWAGICNSTRNIVLKRGDDYTGLDNTLAIPWTLLPTSHYTGTPACTNLSSLLHSLEHGERSNSSDHLMEPSDTFIPAGCSMQWLTSDEMCQTFSSFSELLMIGDSLHRHTVQAMEMLLRDDLFVGGVPVAADRPLIWKECQCDGQFSEAWQCRVDVGQQQVNIAVPNSWHGRYCTAYPEFGVRQIKALLTWNDEALYNVCTNDPRPILLFLQGASHVEHNATRAIEEVIVPTLDYIKSFIVDKCEHNPGFVLLWSGLPAQHRGMDDKYPHQAREKTLAANNITNAFVRQHYNMTVLEYWPLTRGGSTSDGYHFMSEVNLLKAQYLANALRMGAQAQVHYFK